MPWWMSYKLESHTCHSRGVFCTHVEACYYYIDLKRGHTHDHEVSWAWWHSIWIWCLVSWIHLLALVLRRTSSLGGCLHLYMRYCWGHSLLRACWLHHSWSLIECSTYWGLFSLLYTYLLKDVSLRMPHMPPHEGFIGLCMAWGGHLILESYISHIGGDLRGSEP